MGLNPQPEALGEIHPLAEKTIMKKADSPATKPWQEEREGPEQIHEYDKITYLATPIPYTSRRLRVHGRNFA